MDSKKILAGKVLRTSPGKIRFSPEALGEISKAITRSDIRGLAAVGKILIKKGSEHSRGRARKKAAQKRKGRQKGKGRKKGRQYAQHTQKEIWMSLIRMQRAFLKELRDKKYLSLINYHHLLAMSKGGYFRNKRHIKLYLTEHRLIESKDHPGQKAEPATTGHNAEPKVNHG